MIAILSTLLFAAVGLAAVAVILATLHGSRADVRALHALVHAFDELSWADEAMSSPVFQTRYAEPAKITRYVALRPIMAQPAFELQPSLAA